MYCKHFVICWTINKCIRSKIFITSIKIFLSRDPTLKRYSKLQSKTIWISIKVNLYIKVVLKLLCSSWLVLSSSWSMSSSSIEINEDCSIGWPGLGGTNSVSNEDRWTCKYKKHTLNTRAPPSGCQPLTDRKK